MSRLSEQDGLQAPPSYWTASDGEKGRVCNGCGTSGWKGTLVPETIWGLKVTDACQIHDWMYHEGETVDDKREADLVFLLNMLTLIDRKGGWLRVVRRYRAITYYSAVVEAGHGAFWDGK